MSELITCRSSNHSPGRPHDPVDRWQFHVSPMLTISVRDVSPVVAIGSIRETWSRRGSQLTAMKCTRTLPPVSRDTKRGLEAHMDEGVDVTKTNDPRNEPRSTSLTRRQLVQGAAAAGLTVPLAGLVEPSRVRAAVARQEGNGTTLILGLDASPSDLDPQSQYDYRSTIVIRNIYEGLVGLVGSATDEFEGLVAESWEANEDQSVWTFKLRPGLTFHDGSPCDSAAVKASYERVLAMGRGAVNVVSRFVSDPAMMTTPDAATIVFNLGAPQPLFLSAMAATYGVQIVNTKVVMEHEEEGDFGNAWLTLNAEGTGTGAWILA